MRSRLSKFNAPRRTDEAVMVQVVAPSQPTHASQLAAVRRLALASPAATSSDHSSDLGPVSMSRISGGAGSWKSPCPDLVRAAGEQSPGATRHRSFLTAQDLAHFERPLSAGCGLRTSAASRMGARGGSVFSCRPPAGRCGPAGVGQVWLSAHPFFLAGMLIVTSVTCPVNSESSTSLKTLSATCVASSTPTSAVSSAE